MCSRKEVTTHCSKLQLQLRWNKHSIITYIAQLIGFETIVRDTPAVDDAILGLSRDSPRRNFVVAIIGFSNADRLKE